MFQAFDSLSNPTVIGTGSFATGMAKPDIVQFSNWWASNTAILYPECDESKDLGDSAVSAIWNEKELKVGESRVYKTYYGIGEIQRSTYSGLVLGASKIESNFEVNEDGTGYNPVSIMGYAENNGTETLNDVVLEVACDDGITVSQGEQSVSIGSLGVGKTSQTTWTLTAEPSYEIRTVKVLVKAVSKETGEVKPIEYTYTIPALEKPTEEPTVAPTSVVVSNTTGKVATGQSTNVLMLLTSVLGCAGLVSFLNRKCVK